VIRNLNPDASMVDLLKSLVTADEITNLKAELPAYLAKAENLDDTIDKLSWWKTQEHSLPTWCAVVKKSCLFNHPQLQLNVSFRYSILDFVANKNSPFRITLKLL